MSFEKTLLKQEVAKAIAIASTIVYLVVFFPFCWLALFWLVENELSSVRNLIVAFSWFWTPIAIPISIYSTWFCYCKKNYKKELFWCSLPVLAFGAFVFVSAIERM